MHTEDQKSRAYSDACVTQRWSVEDLQYTSEGALAWACFNAGYKLAADATPAPLADAELATIQAALAEAVQAEAAWQADRHRQHLLDYSLEADIEAGKVLLERAPGLLARLAAAEAKVADLLENGSPGVMHKIDKSFYDLAHKELNYERQKNNRLTRELQAATGGQSNG